MGLIAHKVIYIFQGYDLFVVASQSDKDMQLLGWDLVAPDSWRRQCQVQSKSKLEHLLCTSLGRLYHVLGLRKKIHLEPEYKWDLKKASGSS